MQPSAPKIETRKSVIVDVLAAGPANPRARRSAMAPATTAKQPPTQTCQIAARSTKRPEYEVSPPKNPVMTRTRVTSFGSRWRSGPRSNLVARYTPTKLMASKHPRNLLRPGDRSVWIRQMLETGQPRSKQRADESTRCRRTNSQRELPRSEGDICWHKALERNTIELDFDAFGTRRVRCREECQRGERLR